MALVRCENHKPDSLKGGPYVAAHVPPGHPNSGLICGRPDCSNPGAVWLKADEEQQYQSGARIFEVSSNVTKLLLA